MEHPIKLTEIQPHFLLEYLVKLPKFEPLFLRNTLLNYLQSNHISY